MYPKLQTVLQQCLDKRLTLWGWDIKKIFCTKYGIEILLEGYGLDNVSVKSYHDLFSKESGLMEFVKRKEPDDNEEYLCHAGLYISGWNYRIMVMGPMTAKEKIQYFLDNIIV